MGATSRRAKFIGSRSRSLIGTFIVTRAWFHRRERRERRILFVSSFPPHERHFDARFVFLLFSSASSTTHDVIGSAIEVHKDKEPGLLESILLFWNYRTAFPDWSCL